MVDDLLLVVEDDPDNAQIIRMLLTRAGIKVDFAGSAEEALALLESGGRPWGLVIDFRLPEMDGLELVRLLRANPDYAGLRLVGMTAFDTPELRAQSTAAGVDHYFRKPFEHPEFVQTLKRLAP
jgi:two-component system, sensor histidine kinase and response regulator